MWGVAYKMNDSNYARGRGVIGGHNTCECLRRYHGSDVNPWDRDHDYYLWYYQF